MAGAGKGNITTGNISLDIKYIFISFCQYFFAQHTKFKWTSDVKTTKLVIADKNAVELEIVEKRPAIIISRGTSAWTNINSGQRGFEDSLPLGGTKTLHGPSDTSDMIKNSIWTDLLQGTVTFHVLSKSGIQAEEIASELFIALTAYKQDLRAKGIHKVTSLNFGEEQLLRTNASIEYSTVPVALSFLMQKTLRRGETANNCKVYLNSVEVLEHIHYIVKSNGTCIEFLSPPEAGSTVTMTYVDSNTLTTYNNITLTGAADGVNTLFCIPSGSGQSTAGTAILGYYSLLKAIQITDSTQNLQDVNVTSPVDPNISGTYILVGSGVNT